MWTVVIEGFPADIPETWYDCPKAVDRLGPGVVLDAGNSTKRKDLTSLKKIIQVILKTVGACILKNEFGFQMVKSCWDVEWF